MNRYNPGRTVLPIKKRFILFFVIFTTLITTLLGIIAFYFLKSEIELFINAPNKEFISIMGDKLLLKSFISFTLVLIAVFIISIFIGIKLFNSVMKEFINTLNRLTGLAKERVSWEKNDTKLLKKYIDVIIEDQNRLNKLEKVNAWKDGARLLIHEIKNPLTPLKLSVESLSLQDTNNEDIDSALLSIRDVENILKTFKEMVNIDFGPVEEVDFNSFIKDYLKQLNIAHRHIKILNRTKRDKNLITANEALLKMLFNNLVNNGVEANKEKFHIIIDDGYNSLTVKFITPDRVLNNPKQCFIYGFSNKGTNRGYGLYLCKQICDYIGIDIEVNNEEEGVIFSLNIKTLEV